MCAVPNIIIIIIYTVTQQPSCYLQRQQKYRQMTAVNYDSNKARTKEKLEVIYLFIYLLQVKVK